MFYHYEKRERVKTDSKFSLCLILLFILVYVTENFASASKAPEIKMRLLALLAQ